MEKSQLAFFTFTVDGQSDDTFSITRFKGVEGLSRCYEFNIELATSNQELDVDQLIRKTGTLTINRAGEKQVVFHGLLIKIRELRSVHDLIYYEARLVPKLWWLTLTHHNQIFLNQSVPDIIAAVFKDAGLSAQDYELRLTENYQPRDYVCQYEESHYNFVARWMEREGL
jgi:type VI secretion system secreted protein VgrG